MSSTATLRTSPHAPGTTKIIQTDTFISVAEPLAEVTMQTRGAPFKTIESSDNS